MTLDDTHHSRVAEIGHFEFQQFISTPPTLRNLAIKGVMSPENMSILKVGTLTCALAIYHTARSLQS